ncbi:MAG: hypothetical protein ACRENI_07780 [Gemmatimonadaceae bacterium]
MPLHRGDKPAGFVGLIAGGIVLFALLYLISAVTSRSFEGHGESAQAAEPPAANTNPADQTADTAAH